MLVITSARKKCLNLTSPNGAIAICPKVYKISNLVSRYRKGKGFTQATTKNTRQHSVKMAYSPAKPISILTLATCHTKQNSQRKKKMLPTLNSW